MNPTDSKAALRRSIRAAMTNISPAQRAADSANICSLLREQPFWQKAASVLIFAPLPDEPDVWPLLAEAIAGGKIAALPRFDPSDESYSARRVQNPRSEIAAGHFGIREPKPFCSELDLGRVDLILVPGVAFDSGGRRLGRGRGYYDRLLKETTGLKCGIAFHEQIVAQVPAGAHDQLMNFILTPTRCMETAE